VLRPICCRSTMLCGNATGFVLGSAAFGATTCVPDGGRQAATPDPEGYSSASQSNPPANGEDVENVQRPHPKAADPCNCHGYDGPGGPCYSGPGGPAYNGPGGPAYAGPGGPCYSGPGGPAYNGPGGPRYSGPTLDLLWTRRSCVQRAWRTRIQRARRSCIRRRWRSLLLRSRWPLLLGSRRKRHAVSACLQVRARCRNSIRRCSPHIF